jgi:hypothetical protein
MMNVELNIYIRSKYILLKGRGEEDSQTWWTYIIIRTHSSSKPKNLFLLIKNEEISSSFSNPIHVL